MCPLNFTEFFVENTALAWLEASAHAPLHGSDIGAGELRVVNAEQFLRAAV